MEEVDPILLNVAQEHINKGDIVWDIGANVGLFTFAAANLVEPTGKVLAIEPDTWLVSLLRKSSQLEENIIRLHVDVLPVAISDQVGIAKFNVAKRGRATNHLSDSTGSTQTGGIREVHLVPTVSLDWLLDNYTAPSFIKIDVEGAEHLVLNGAKKLLSEIRPVIFCEVSSENAEAVTNILKKFNYTLFDATANKNNRKSLQLATWNTLAYPLIHPV
ncbi:MAG: FkbM family methyltransferase [Gammaproteobacteria bacterium]|nr:FkbM family methyltransferase [Gammaproteobacteria bacterium]